MRLYIHSRDRIRVRTCTVHKYYQLPQFTNDRNDSRIQVQLSSLDANCVYAVVAVFYLKTSRIQRTITRTIIRTRTRTFKKHSSLGLGYIRSVFASQRNIMNPNSHSLQKVMYLHELHEPIESGSKV